jgi:serine/threonine-protein kinase
VIPAILVLSLVGLGVGYSVGSRILFPAPERPAGLVEVPDLKGLTEGALSARLQGAQLVLGSADSVHHPTVEAGQVLGQSPLPGQAALPGDSVRVMLSMGPRERPVPDVLRIRSDRARSVLEASGFIVLEDSVESDLPLGGVVDIAPEPGTMVALPAEVTLTVSLGPPLVEMPMVVGLTQEAAVAALEAVGLEVGEVEERFRFGLPEGTVIEQEPAAETEIPQGSRVRLVVGRRSG